MLKDCFFNAAQSKFTPLSLPFTANLFRDWWLSVLNVKPFLIDAAPLRNLVLCKIISNNTSCMFNVHRTSGLSKYVSDIYLR